MQRPIIERLERRDLLSVSVNVNFQPAGAAVPAGYLADTGVVFADRGNGYSYGWSLVNTAYARDRNSSKSPDQRYDTLNFMQKSKNTNATWEIALPNGSYNVKIVSGDPSSTDNVYKINVENVLVVDGVPTSANPWVQGTATVTVSDGRLSVSPASGAVNAKICFIDITSAGEVGNTAPIVNAGSDKMLTLPNATTTLSGSVSDDGLPNPPAAVTAAWSVVSKPANSTVTFGNTSAATTSASFSHAGAYTLRLTGSDSSLSASDTVNITVNPQVTANGPIAWYKLDEGAGSTANDSSGNNFAGTLTKSPVWTAGKSGSALAFDTTLGNRVVVADRAALDISSAITLAAWVKPSQLAHQYVIIKAQAGSVNGYELGLHSNGKAYVRLNQASNADTFRVDSTTSYPTTGGTWIHIAGVFDGTTLKMYVNGVLEGSKSAATTIAVNARSLGIGAQDDGFRGMKGAVDDARIYNRALSAPEVSAIVGTVATPTLAEQVARTLAFAKTSVLATLNEIGNSTTTYVERTNDDGTWKKVAASHWTSGFLPGTMWQLFENTNDVTWRDRATNWTLNLAGQTTQDGDLAFRFMTTFRPLYDLTNNSTYRQVLLNAAAEKNSHWNETVGAFETTWFSTASGNPQANFAVLMDMTTDLELMFWAAGQTGNQQYYDRSIRHMEKVIANNVRADGSISQFAMYNRNTGAFVMHETYQGYANNSTWGRGQAWAVLSFADVARTTGRSDFIAAAKKVADWFISHTPTDGIPFWDINDPAIPNTYRDSSAAAIAASGLLNLADYLGKTGAGAPYFAAAEKILTSLTSSAYLAEGTKHHGILTHGAANVPNLVEGRDNSLIYGDYYLLHAINRWQGM